MPCSVHTEPCSPGICGQQERLFPIAGKYNIPNPIVGQLAALDPLSDTTPSDAINFHFPLKFGRRPITVSKPTAAKQPHRCICKVVWRYVLI